MFKKGIDRREFLRIMAAASLGIMSHNSIRAMESSDSTISSPFASPRPKVKERLIGFNLLNKFNPDYHTPFSEEDFEIMAEWGFNFARIPLSYWCWSSEDDWYRVDEKCMRDIDKVVELGKQYKIHVNLNFHRAPGYCINPPKPKANLFEDEAALEACAFHWKMFAERYKSYPTKYLSFNLINEAPSIQDQKYERVVRHLIKTIREVNPKRMVIVDGLDVGNRPLMSITDIDNIIQSGRGYQPMIISHYEANWVYGNGPMYLPKEKLGWPMKDVIIITIRRGCEKPCAVIGFRGSRQEVRSISENSVVTIALLTMWLSSGSEISSISSASLVGAGLCGISMDRLV